MKGLIEERQAELHRLYPVWKKQTIWGFFKATAARCPQAEFILTADGERYTYQQAEAAILKIAQGALALGIRPGDHVALQIDNCPELILLSLALSALRAVKIPVNIHLGTRELGYILKQSESAYLFTGLEPELTGLDTDLRAVVTLPGAKCRADVPVCPWKALLSGGTEQPLPSCEEESCADEISDIIYTSGSTSAPKGVPLSHDMIMRSVYASSFARGLELGRRFFVPLPLFHVFGYLKGLLAAVLVGGAVLLRRGKFLAEPAIRFMRESQANDIICVPAQMRMLINYLRESPTELPALHAAYCSASVCPAWIWPGIRETLHISDIVTGYGMTETCGGAIQTSPFDSDEIRCTRVGRILNADSAGLPEYDGCLIAYRVVDQATGELCPPGQAGELWCKGLVVTQGYFQRPEINAKAFTDDGWFKTGDCGWFDEQGYLCLSGRVDDMYKINGENVSPKFLEDTVSACPVVSVIAVVGIPDARHGYVGAAFLQLTEDTPENRRQAEQYCQEHLARFQIPKYYIYVTEADWPRTASGKIQKFKLRQRAEACFPNSGMRKSVAVKHE